MGAAKGGEEMKNIVYKCKVCGSPCLLKVDDESITPEFCPFNFYTKPKWEIVSISEFPELEKK